LVYNYSKSLAIVVDANVVRCAHRVFGLQLF